MTEVNKTEEAKPKLNLIGDDFPETEKEIWCPKCGEDGTYEFGESREDYEARVEQKPLEDAPGIAECPNGDCRVATFTT